MNEVRIGRVVASIAIAGAAGMLAGFAVYLMFAAAFPVWLIVTINIVIGIPIGWSVMNWMWPWCLQTQRPKPSAQWTEDLL